MMVVVVPDRVAMDFCLIVVIEMDNFTKVGIVVFVVTQGEGTIADGHGMGFFSSRSS